MFKPKIIFICDTRDFHSMDWFKVVSSISPKNSIYLVSDIYEKNLDSNKDYNFIKLFNINSVISNKNSRISDLWRNILKLLITPYQVFLLRNLKKKYPNAFFHAHSMYYIFLCWLANLKFIATPMGSDVLVRPDESFIYKFFTIKSLKAAYLITVDSINLKNKIRSLSKQNCLLIQNGIDSKEIEQFVKPTIKREGVVSIRGFHPNYQIEKVISSRDLINPKPAIKFVYPFYDEKYRNQLLQSFQSFDLNIGRLNKPDLYKLLSSTLLVVSVPISDSSPRSVYEAIFCGCCVAVTKSPWVDTLPKCMADRVVVIHEDNPYWLKDAINVAREITSHDFIPSDEALINFDQFHSMKYVCKNIYKTI